MADASFFPSCRAEGLALAYAEAHLTDDMTPEDFARLYRDAYRRINDELVRLSREDRQKP